MLLIISATYAAGVPDGLVFPGFLGEPMLHNPSLPTEPHIGCFTIQCSAGEISLLLHQNTAFKAVPIDLEGIVRIHLYLHWGKTKICFKDDGNLKKRFVSKVVWWIEQDPDDEDRNCKPIQTKRCIWNQNYFPLPYSFQQMPKVLHFSRRKVHLLHFMDLQGRCQW